MVIRNVIILVSLLFPMATFSMEIPQTEIKKQNIITSPDDAKILYDVANQGKNIIYILHDDADEQKNKDTQNSNDNKELIKEFFKAIKEDDLSQIQALINQGANINTRYESGVPLVSALYRDKKESDVTYYQPDFLTVQLLLKNNANPLRKSVTGHSGLVGLSYLNWSYPDTGKIALLIFKSINKKDLNFLISCLDFLGSLTRYYKREDDKKLLKLFLYYFGDI